MALGMVGNGEEWKVSPSSNEMRSAWLTLSSLRGETPCRAHSTAEGDREGTAQVNWPSLRPLAPHPSVHTPVLYPSISDRNPLNPVSYLYPMTLWISA